MEGEIKARMHAYIEAFEEVKQSVGDDHVACAILQEIAKDLRTEQIRAERHGEGMSWSSDNGGNNGQPATDKQIAYLIKLGVNVPDNVTKKEASELLDEALGATSSTRPVMQMPRRVP